MYPATSLEWGSPVGTASAQFGLFVTLFVLWRAGAARWRYGRLHLSVDDLLYQLANFLVAFVAG